MILNRSLELGSEALTDETSKCGRVSAWPKTRAAAIVNAPAKETAGAFRNHCTFISKPGGSRLPSALSSSYPPCSSCVHLANTILNISMPRIPLTVALCLALAYGAAAQTSPSPGSPPINLTLQDAMQRARQYSQQVYTANIAALLAHEDTVQAKAALLPTVNAQPVHLHPAQRHAQRRLRPQRRPSHLQRSGAVHADIFDPGKRADYRRAMAAEAVARAKADLAARGLVATVMQNYYAMAVAQRKLANARRACSEAQEFLDITQKQERGGEAAQVDVVKAQLQVSSASATCRKRSSRSTRRASVSPCSCFPITARHSPWWTIWTARRSCRPIPEIQTLAGKNSPDIRAAQATVQQQNFAITSARAAYLPTLTLDYFFGIRPTSSPSTIPRATTCSARRGRRS